MRAPFPTVQHKQYPLAGWPTKGENSNQSFMYAHNPQPRTLALECQLGQHPHKEPSRAEPQLASHILIPARTCLWPGNYICLNCIQFACTLAGVCTALFSLTIADRKPVTNRRHFNLTSTLRVWSCLLISFPAPTGLWQWSRIPEVTSLGLTSSTPAGIRWCLIKGFCHVRRID